MSDQDIHPSKFSELRSIYKYHIDSYIALCQLKTEKEEELNKIYKMIKAELLDSKKYSPEHIIIDILTLIQYRNRYTKSYLTLAKLISDDYHVKEAFYLEDTPNYLFYKEYGIYLDKSCSFESKKFRNPEILSENEIVRAIMYNDKELFISFTEKEGFNEDQRIISCLYPDSKLGLTLLDLCCYYGAVDCFKFLRSKFNSKITLDCLHNSFLGGNQEIISECLKYQEPNNLDMRIAIILHNIDFVTFLMNEYNLSIDLSDCAEYNNLESFLVYFDQTNKIDECFKWSA
ncbi:hypothetical protein TVAG_275760 [Trichomonas vaginalis G3]|uniref:DUF3447 domain-containing protein n=1 Tax=Trichomonas vaginalis (strain ATCC PRA-98 / G3) TaxID=412133 RepID=A2EYE9_TRIV3|nr:protein of unknown function (DUF3447) [Trichomonas vaginalis G3]EAY02302.1 hypothetical protein TVAG_275760 [Trichomonas vaginalis G3]KAI5500885.1 protein of unknown function (DUF3447) [Trichomonas vaginalis G3]|eukprot:XP_001314617.1 hypothetical protein [Trichomonas vaginalis G3]